MVLFLFLFLFKFFIALDPNACTLQKVEKLKTNLHFLTESAQNSHTIFVDEEEEVKRFDAVKHFDTVPQLAECAYNRPRKATLKNSAAMTPDTKTMRQALRSGTQRYEELAERLQRIEKLENVLQHQQAEKYLMVSVRSNTQAHPFVCLSFVCWCGFVNRERATNEKYEMLSKGVQRSINGNESVQDKWIISNYLQMQ